MADLIAYDHLDQVCDRGELQHSFLDRKPTKNAFELGKLLANPGIKY